MILMGVGKVFFVGGNVKVMKEKEGSFVGLGVCIVDGYWCGIYVIVKFVWNIEVLVIVVVNGLVIGLGNDVVCLVDMCIVFDSVVFGVIFFKVGFVFGDGGVWLLL